MLEPDIQVAWKPIVELLQTIDVSTQDVHGKRIKGKDIIHSKIQDGVKFQKHDTHHSHSEQHTQYLLLSDHHHFFKIDLKTSKIKTFESKNHPS